MTPRLCLVGLLAACVSPTAPASPTATLTVELRVDHEDTEDVVLTTVGVRLDEVIVEADGPEGAVSLSGVSSDEVTLLDPAAAVAMAQLELAAGTYDDAIVRVVLRESGPSHALWATGSWQHDDRLVPFDLEVRPTLTLVAQTDLTMEEGDRSRLVFSLRPDEWFDELDEDDLVGVSVLRLEPQSGSLYDAVIEDIVSSTGAELVDEPNE